MTLKESDYFKVRVPNAVVPQKQSLTASVNVCQAFLPYHACLRGIAVVILSVRLSVSLSVTRIFCDKTNTVTADIFTPHERPILSF